MASLRRKPNTKYWIACFRGPDGKHLQRSTKTTDKRLALKLANDFERTSEGRLTEQQARRVISDLHKMVSGDSLSFPTLEAYLSGWLNAKQGTVASSTYTAYRSVVDSFLEFMGSRAVVEIGYVTRNDITGYRDHIAGTLSAQTANNKLKVLRVAFRQAWRDGVIESDPASKVPILKVSPDEESKRRAFTVPELKRILDVAEGEWAGMILFGLYTGQRLGDIARLTWDNIDLEKNLLSFKTRKTGRQQILPLAPSLRRWIEDQPQEAEPLFPRAFDSVGRTGRVATLSNSFYDLMSRAQLVPKRTHEKKVGSSGSGRHTQTELSFHSLRHTATSLMKNAGVSPAIVQEFVGHNSKVISDNYTHIELRALSEATEALPDLSRE